MKPNIDRVQFFAGALLRDYSLSSLGDQQIESILNVAEKLAARLEARYKESQ